MKIISSLSYRIDYRYRYSLGLERLSRMGIHALEGPVTVAGRVKIPGELFARGQPCTSRTCVRHLDV